MGEAEGDGVTAGVADGVPVTPVSASSGVAAGVAAGLADGVT